MRYAIRGGLVIPAVAAGMRRPLPGPCIGSHLQSARSTVSLSFQSAVVASAMPMLLWVLETISSLSWVALVPPP